MATPNISRALDFVDSRLPANTLKVLTAGLAASVLAIGLGDRVERVEDDKVRGNPAALQASGAYESHYDSKIDDAGFLGLGLVAMLGAGSLAAGSIQLRKLEKQAQAEQAVTGSARLST